MRKLKLKLGAAALVGTAAVMLATSGALAGLTYDLSIAKSHTGNFTAGQNGTFTITVSNAANTSNTGTIDQVKVTDTLPTGLTYVSHTAGTANWSCSASGQTVTCTAIPNLTAGSSTSFTITVAVATNAASAVTNTATVSAPNDTNANNNSASDRVTINPAPSPSPSPSPSPTQSAAPASTAPTLPRAGGPGIPTGLSWAAIAVLGTLLLGGVAATARQLRQ